MYKINWKFQNPKLTFHSIVVPWASNHINCQKKKLRQAYKRIRVARWVSIGSHKKRECQHKKGKQWCSFVYRNPITQKKRHTAQWLYLCGHSMQLPQASSKKTLIASWHLSRKAIIINIKCICNHPTNRCHMTFWDVYMCECVWAAAILPAFWLLSWMMRMTMTITQCSCVATTLFAVIWWHHVHYI